MKKVQREIADGELGIDQTVQNMWRLINRDVKDQRVQKIANRFKKSNNIETAKAVFNYVWKTFPYKSDPDGIEHFTAPVYLLRKEFTKHLDCDDLVGIVAVLLLANKIPVRLKTIQWRRNDFTHIILDAKIDNYWIPLDPVKKSDGFGNQITEALPGVTFRQKIYSNPMGTLVTLEDCVGCGKRQSQPANQNIITVNTGTTNSNAIPGSGFLANLLNSMPGFNIFGGSDKTTNNNYLPSENPKTENQKVIERVIEKPYPVEKKVKVKEPYPVYKTITIPSRAINLPNVVNYREFY